MSLSLILDFVAPVPTGHRVQVIRAQRWVTSLFGGVPHWADIVPPLIFDLDTGVVYCGDGLGEELIASPLAFKPNSGFQVASITEGRVTSCIVSSDRVGELRVVKTYLVVEPTPQGYRQ